MYQQDPRPSPKPYPTRDLVSGKASRILHKLHGGLGEQLIGLELREGRDNVTSVLLCAREKGRGVHIRLPPLSALPSFWGTFLYRELLPTQDSVEV